MKIDKNIKYILFEVQEVVPLETNAYSEKSLYYHDLPSAIFEANHYLEDRNWNSIFTAMSHYFSNIFYLKKLNQTNYFIDEGCAYYKNGYYPLEKEYDRLESVKTLRDNYVKDTTQVFLQRDKPMLRRKMNIVLENEIKKLNKECEKRGIKLILVSSLFTEPKDFSFIKENSSLKILDFTSRSKFKEFYTSKNAYDNGHLNIKGSKIFSVKLADSLNVFVKSLK